MLKENVLESLNRLLNLELETSRYFLAAAGWCFTQNLNGFAGWCLGHSKSHESTAIRYFNYIHERGGEVTLGSFDDHKAQFSSVLELVESTLSKELTVSSASEELYNVAIKENDKPVIVTLNKFVILAQVAKEKSLNQLISKIKLVGTSGQALIMLDRSLFAN